MKFKGRLIDIARNILSGEFRITIGLRSIPTGLDALREDKLDISMKCYRRNYA